MSDATASKAQPSRSKAVQWLSRLLLVLMGIGLAVLIVEGLLHLFPDWAQGARPRSLSLGTVRFTVGIGDLFINRPGQIAPPPNPYDVLSEHPLAWDADGFRVPARPSDRYRVIALGDSYTEAANVASPWPDVLAARSGLAVRNLGFRGYGPVEELRVFRDYGATAHPQLVIVGFFEGNDLYDEISARWRGPFLLPSLARQSFAPFDPNARVWETTNTGPFQFPVRLSLAGTLYNVAFLDSYLWWLNGDYADYAQSDNMAALRATWRELRAAAGPACLVVAYLPSAPHIYAPYVVPDDRARLMSTMNRLSLAKPGALLETSANDRTFEAVMARLDNQRDAIARLAAELKLPFVDLVPAFKSAAVRGEYLYYAYDTHWNQAGHSLAGQTLADFLAQHPEPCGTPG
jgi:GDSL-like Lipase/Acylhydrolase family